MDEKSAREFLLNDCVVEKSPDELTALIQRSREAVLGRSVPDLEARTRALPPGHDRLISEIEHDRRLPDVVKGRRWSLSEVEIDKLVSMQRYIDTEYADTVADRLDLATVEGRIKFCLTDQFRVRESEIVQMPSAFTFAVKGSGADLRVVDMGSTHDPLSGDRTISFTVGWGRPFVQVMKLRGRYVLKNGYHRAFALRKRGFEYIPCVLLEGDDYADLECTGPPTFFSEDTVFGARPPVFSSFFDPEITSQVKMRSYGKAVVIRPDFTLLEPDSLAAYLRNEVAGAPEQSDDELEYLDVRARREEWNVYKLADGTILKLRVVVTRINRPRVIGAQVVPDISNVMLICNPPRNKKGPPMLSRPGPGELTDAIIDPDMRFTTIKEPVNEYLTTDGKRVLVRLRLYNLASTSKYDAKGDPIYLINAKPVVTVDS